MQLIRKYAGIFLISLNAGILLYVIFLINLFYSRHSKTNRAVLFSDVLHFIEQHNMQIIICGFLLPFTCGLLLIQNKTQKSIASALSMIGLVIYSCIPYL